MTPGKNPASAAPRTRRMVRNEVGPTTKAVAPATRPQLIMMRASQRLAPTRCMIRLLGTSNRK